MWNASYSHLVIITDGEVRQEHRFTDREYGHAVALYYEFLMAGFSVTINTPIVETSL